MRLLDSSSNYHPSTPFRSDEVEHEEYKCEINFFILGSLNPLQITILQPPLRVMRWTMKSINVKEKYPPRKLTNLMCLNLS